MKKYRECNRVKVSYLIKEGNAVITVEVITLEEWRNPIIEAIKLVEVWLDERFPVGDGDTFESGRRWTIVEADAHQLNHYTTIMEVS